MNRRGLWAGGVALILLVVGAAALTTVGAGYAKDEDASSSRAKCTEATLKGTYLFAQNGVEIKGNDQKPFAIAGYDVFDGNGKVKGLASGNINGETFRKDPFTGTYSVKANCTGTFTFRGGAAATQGDNFIAPDGSKFAFVRTNPEFVSAGFDLRERPRESESEPLRRAWAEEVGRLILRPGSLLFLPLFTGVRGSRNSANFAFWAF